MLSYKKKTKKTNNTSKVLSVFCKAQRDKNRKTMGHRQRTEFLLMSFVCFFRFVSFSLKVLLSFFVCHFLSHTCRNTQRHALLNIHLVYVHISLSLVLTGQPCIFPATFLLHFFLFLPNVILSFTSSLWCMCVRTDLVCGYISDLWTPVTTGHQWSLLAERYLI